VTTPKKQLALVHIVNPVRGEHRVVEAGDADGARAVVERIAKRHGAWTRTRRLASNPTGPALTITDVRVPAGFGTYEYASFWERV